jgi:uncharacterized protein YjbI with pentapeptide repeats
MPSVTRLAQDVAARVWSVVTTRSQQGWRWLIDQGDPLTWASLRAKLITLKLPKTYAGRLALLGGVALLLLPVLLWYAAEQKDDKGAITYPHASLINPILGGLGALLLIYAAIRQARTATEQAETARKQAQTASDRHEAQTEADRQRRITESFSKAIEQLGSDKLEVRLGGIYALERISQESPKDFGTVMENLTAFVRERTRPEANRLAKPLDQRIADRAYSLWERAGRPEGRSAEFWRDAVRQEKDGEPPATDIAAVLTVIKRRDEEHRALETRDKMVLDFRQAVLRRANLSDAHLERADLSGAHLEGASLFGAHLEDTLLRDAHLEGADLSEAHLERANLVNAHLEGADLSAAHLEDANFLGAHLESAGLGGAHLERAGLLEAHLEDADLIVAHLEDTLLRDAHLEGARLLLTDLEGAILNEAHLEGADLSDAEGLAQRQIDRAFGDEATKLPEGLSRPAHWTAPKDGTAPEQRNLP